MTDSMNFGPDWIRNLSSEGSTGGTSGGTRYQLADFRYGREEMLALFDRNIKPPTCLANFKSLYSDITLPPLALLPVSDEERGGWQGRSAALGGPPRGRGGSLERGGRINRGRGSYQSYGRPSNYEGNWGNGEPSDWSPRKEYNPRPVSMDNWRRSRNSEEDDGWRMSVAGRGGLNEKWGRQTSWRAEGEEERTGPPERGGRSNWHELNRNSQTRKPWENEDHLPEWANENPLESGGSFDDRGAFHGSDDEQLEGRGGGQKREGLQKSTSQQHISHKSHPPLLSSKSTISLVKDCEQDLHKEDNDPPNNLEMKSRDISVVERERKLSVPEVIDKSANEVVSNRERAKSEGPPKHSEPRESPSKLEHKVEENDFEKLQEDFVSKLVIDEEPPKSNNQTQNNYEITGMVPPPNLTVPGQDKWFYQDPQGQMQGPFTSMEMSEWFKAGYFGQDLKVRRQCDERFFLLGELMAMCGNSNPFQTTVRFPVLKNDISKMPENDLQFQYLSQVAAYKQAQARVMADPWSAIAVQQQELAAQRLIMQQQQQVQQDLQYIQQPPTTNPLMQMISQMQQVNKLPNNLIDKQQPNIPSGTIDPHLHMHMTNFISMQSRLPSGLPNHMPTGLPSGVTGPMPPDTLAAGLSGLPGSALGTPGIPIQSGLTSGLGLNVPRPSNIEHSSAPDNDPISSLLKQLQQKQQQQQNQVESLWQQNQFGVPNSNPPQQQWPAQVQPEVPLSMWDIQQSSKAPSPAQQQQQIPTEASKTTPSQVEPQPTEKLKKTEKSKEARQKEEEKELKKKRKSEDELQKKEADEKRKQEQRKQEAEKKMEQERRRKEEERIKRELEKAKKDAEEKRMRELEEKRRLKEQRKLEEEAKKRTEEENRKIEEERIQREKEQREREERQKAEERRLEQLAMTKVAPWSQSNSTLGMSLSDIQKAERERKVQEATLQAQRAHMERELQLQQQQQLEKSGGIQLGWAKKTIEPRKVESLAEIQAEEQDRLAKEAAEARLRKEKEVRETVQLPVTSTIWSGQSLTWASASSTQPQWSSSTNISGFWDDQPSAATLQKSQQSSNKPSTLSKSSSMSTINSSASKQVQASKQQAKTKPKKEEVVASTNKKNHNNNIDDEFTSWCYKALGNISTNVDIPTFVAFLKDIESAFEVREYCKEYLGENQNTQQFANNFLEKRRSFKPRNAHKDDMCSPAPAITPSMHNSTEFQEVKGKNKKNKKSKMLKVDARILGFNVTSAPDRINVGDRDYGDNS